jgi:hypothetical protein
MTDLEVGDNKTLLHWACRLMDVWRKYVLSTRELAHRSTGTILD